MADVAVAVEAIEHLLRIAGVSVDAVDDLLVAANAVFLEHGDVARADHDGLMKVLERETLRVPETVLGFAEIFPDEVVRRVAVVGEWRTGE